VLGDVFGTRVKRWLEAEWAALEGTRVAFVDADSAGPDGIQVMHAVDDTFSRWASENDVQAVIVRPDRYVHAAVSSAVELAQVIQDLSRVLIS
jgi:hypothetical protein